VIILENVYKVKGFKWSYTQLFSREGEPPPTSKEIPPVLSTLLAMHRVGTCSVLYLMSGNELAVYQTLRDIYRFLQFTNILLKDAFFKKKLLHGSV